MPTVETIMTPNVLTTDPAARVKDAARRMVERRVGAILVREGERLVGIMTERDVLRAVGSGYDPNAVVSQWMTRNPETIAPSDTTDHAGMLMDHGGFRHLPVLEGERLVGIVSIRDILRAGLQDQAPRGV
jgi:CBS domain-containing protein